MFRRNTMEKTMRKALDYLEDGDFISAKNEYLKSFAADPDNIGIINNLAQIYAILGDEDKSKGYSEMLLEKCEESLRYEKNLNLLIFKANALISLEKYEEMHEVLDEILKIDPNNTLALFQKAHYLEKTGHHKKAIESLEKLLHQKNCDIALLLSMSRNLIEINEFERAERCFKLAFQIETKNKAAINLKSKMLKKKYNLTMTPHDFMLKAVENFEMENFEASADYFKKAIEMDSGFDEIWFAQGELFVRTGRIGDAINSFKKAFELNPTSGGIEKREDFFKMLKRMKKINTLLGFEKS